jgi:hypothetical protein
MASMFRCTYLKNIKEYYETKTSDDINKILSGTDVFDKATYDLYKMILDNKSENEIDEQIKYINTVPVKYYQMRSIFG